MLLDDGVMYICTLTNTAKKGGMPKETLTRTKKYWFGQRSVGYNRQYAAMGVNQRVDMLVRIPYDPKITIGMYAVLGNGEQYRIDNVQMGGDYTYSGTVLTGSGEELRYTDLTLQRLEALYDVAD